MEAIKERKQAADTKEKESLLGTLVATTLFVGGGIVFFIVLLFAIYMIRV